jgi:hypothetical protein
MQLPYIETNCTIEHNGRKFTCGGAFVSPTHLIAYPADNGRLNDWHGNQIGTYSITSSREAIFFGRRSWMASRYYFMRATVNLQRYSLRGFGKGMIARGKALRA